MARISQSKMTAFRAGCCIWVVVVGGSLARAYTQKAVVDTRRAVTIKAKDRQCGSWQDGYIELHKDILSGRKPPRYAISVPAPAGLSDRLVGAVSVFYYALLTNRAFQIAGDLMARLSSRLAYNLRACRRLKISRSRFNHDSPPAATCLLNDVA